MFDLAPVVPVCLLDPPQFSAAILNLVINARDAMPNGGEVRISTETCELKAAAPGLPAPGTYLRVRVRDEGDGMSADTLRKIFDPYFTTKGELGTGLGLPQIWRSEEHTSELQSLMRISYAVFCLKKKTTVPATPQQT